jgi:hypothetical protein
VVSTKLLKNKKLHYSIVTEVQEITISPLYELEETFQRTIQILTVYGETLALVLYAGEKSTLEFLFPLEEEDLRYPNWPK